MKSPCLLVVAGIILIVPITANGQQTAENVVDLTEALTGIPSDLKQLFTETQRCIRSLWANSEAVKRRFTVRQIAGLCKNRQLWLSKSTDFQRKLRSEDNPSLTKRQRDWLNHIRTCGTIESCVCPNGACQQGNRKHSRSKRQAAPTGRASSITRSIRKEYRRMTLEERNIFHSAMWQFKNDQIDGRSKFDILVYYHQPEQAPGAHWGPAFLPWHREFLRQLEVGLRSYDLDLALPYWDSSLDQGLPVPEDSILFTNEFMGSSNLYVQDGPFQEWSTVHSVLEEPRIVRNLGQSRFGSLYRPDDFNLIGSKTSYEELTSCVDPYFELIHGAVHLWVGGHMADIPISPNDPLFFLHHGFVDYIWEEWRQTKQSPTQRETDYPSQRFSCNALHYANASMLPFGRLNIGGLSNVYTDSFYAYQSRPVCSPSEPLGCRSPYLICDDTRWRCVSKVRIGGNCTGFENTDICLGGECQFGVCVFQNEGGNQVSPILPDPVQNENHINQPVIRNQQEIIRQAPSPSPPSPTRRQPPRLVSRPPPQTQRIADPVSQALHENPFIVSSGESHHQPPQFPQQHGPRAADFNAYSSPSHHKSPSPSQISDQFLSPSGSKNIHSSPQENPSNYPSRRPNHSGHPPNLPVHLKPESHDLAAPIQHASSAKLSRVAAPVQSMIKEIIKSDALADQCCPCQIGGINDFERTFSAKRSSNLHSLDDTSPDSVWFSVSIFIGDIQSGTRIPIHSAQITSEGLNYAGSMAGRMASSNVYPHYPGAGYARVRNPKKIDLGFAQAQITVIASDGSPCQSYCYEDGSYIPCSGIVVLNTNLNRSDPILYTPFAAQVMYLGWNANGRRKPDYHLFLCKQSEPQSTPAQSIPQTAEFQQSGSHQAAAAVVYPSDPRQEYRPEGHDPPAVVVHPQHDNYDGLIEDYPDEIGHHPLEPPPVSSTHHRDFDPSSTTVYEEEHRTSGGPSYPLERRQPIDSDLVHEYPAEQRGRKHDSGGTTFPTPQGFRNFKETAEFLAQPFVNGERRAAATKEQLKVRKTVLKHSSSQPKEVRKEVFDDQNPPLEPMEKTELSKKDKCKFLRFDGFILVGYAAHVQEGLDEEECKDTCRNLESVMCNSVTYWKEFGTCIINEESRHSQPDLFTYRAEENATYFDFVCDLNKLLEL